VSDLRQFCLGETAQRASSAGRLNGDSSRWRMRHRTTLRTYGLRPAAILIGPAGNAANLGSPSVLQGGASSIIIHQKFLSLDVFVVTIKDKMFA
jgi:hypothetical protein